MNGRFFRPIAAANLPLPGTQKELGEPIKTWVKAGAACPVS
jgi:hypothetical protein